MMPAQAGPSGADRTAERIWKAADADGRAIVERLMIAERAAATGRFEAFWPTPTESRVMPPTRRLLRDWYVRVLENQLARGILAPAISPIDGMEAERVMAAVRARTGADSPIVVDVVIELARDGRSFADHIARARKDYVDAALRGRIGRLFQRSARTPVSMRQALAEQWYLRSFRAAVEPPLYRLDTPPITTAEIQAVGVSLATAQPWILHRDGRPIGPATPDGWRTHTAQRWAAMSADARAAWLTQRSWDADFTAAGFHQLPLTVQSELLRQYPPIRPIQSQGIATGGPLQAAAEAFGTTPVRAPSDTDRELASVLFSRGGVTLPPQLLHHLPDNHAVQTTLHALHAANRRTGEMRGHPWHSQYWSDDQQRDRAVQMRKDGMSFQSIANQLNMTPKHVAKALREDSSIPEELVHKLDRPEWTEERLRAAAYLRSQGHTYQQIAAVFGYRTGQTIRYALTMHGPELGIDPVTGRTIPAGETPPDPTRWAPRLSPWTGAPRTGEDPAVVAERRKRDRQARSCRSGNDGVKHEDVKHEVQSDLLGRMIQRRQAIIADDHSGITSPNRTEPTKTDNPTTRHA